MRFPLRPSVTPRSTKVVEADEVEEANGDSVEDVKARILFWRALFWLIMVFAVQTVAALSPELVENYYSQLIYYYLVRWLSVVNKFFPVAIGEALIALIIIWYIGWTFWYFGRVFRRESSFLDVIKVLLLQWAWLFTIFFALFLFMWGLNYQRMPIEERMDLERRAEGREEIINVGRRIIDGVNRNYSTREASSVTGASQMTIGHARLHQSIENAFQLEGMLGAASQGGFANPRPLYFSNVATWLDIRGVYVPYTGEAVYNERVLDCDLPFVIAHVKAHQRGYAREDEANFIAFVICIKSNEPYIRYSGYLHALKVLDFLAKSDVQAAEFLKAQAVPGAVADIKARETYWERSKSPYLATATNAITNIYLRANRIRGGLKNFSEDTPLIVNYMLSNPER